MALTKQMLTEARRIIKAGACVGLEQIVPPRCEFIVPKRLYTQAHGCPYEAKFRTRDGRNLCIFHAERWAAENIGDL